MTRRNVVLHGVALAIAYVLSLPTVTAGEPCGACSNDEPFAARQWCAWGCAYNSEGQGKPVHGTGDTYGNALTNCAENAGVGWTVEIRGVEKTNGGSCPPGIIVRNCIRKIPSPPDPIDPQNPIPGTLRGEGKSSDCYKWSASASCNTCDGLMIAAAQGHTSSQAKRLARRNLRYHLANNCVTCSDRVKVYSWRNPKSCCDSCK